MSDTLPEGTRNSSMLRLPSAATATGLSWDGVAGSSTGAGIVVAVIDSGIDASHPRLGGCVDDDRGVVVARGPQGAVVLERRRHDDAFGHGTACAGIIHAVAPGATIRSVQVVRGWRRDPAAVAAAFEVAVADGAHVINASIGTVDPATADALHRVCRAARDAGCLVVAAASNRGDPGFPASFPEVTSVACNTSTAPLRFHRNPGPPPPHLLARGIDVEVAWVGGATVRGTGNSYAAAHVSGLAAVVRAAHPELGPVEVHDLLLRSAANSSRPGGAPAGRLARSRATRTVTIPVA